MPRALSCIVSGSGIVTTSATTSAYETGFDNLRAASRAGLLAGAARNISSNPVWGAPAPGQALVACNSIESAWQHADCGSSTEERLFLVAMPTGEGLTSDRAVVGELTTPRPSLGNARAYRVIEGMTEVFSWSAVGSRPYVHDALAAR